MVLKLAYSLLKIEKETNPKKSTLTAKIPIIWLHNIPIMFSKYFALISYFFFPYSNSYGFVIFNASFSLGVLKDQAIKTEGS